MRMPKEKLLRRNRFREEALRVFRRHSEQWEKIVLLHEIVVRIDEVEPVSNMIGPVAPDHTLPHPAREKSRRAATVRPTRASGCRSCPRNRNSPRTQGPRVALRATRWRTRGLSGHAGPRSTHRFDHHPRAVGLLERLQVPGKTGPLKRRAVPFDHGIAGADDQPDVPNGVCRQGEIVRHHDGPRLRSAHRERRQGHTRLLPARKAPRARQIQR